MATTQASTRALDWGGATLITVSAAGFATLAIFGKLAFAAGMTLPTMLALRFSGAAALFWFFLTVTGLVAARLTPGKVGRLLIMGGIGYAGQSTLYMLAVALIPAAVVGMLLYTYPAWVTLLAWWLDGDRPDRPRWLALALALGGTTLIAGDPGGAVNAVGVGLALLAGLWYACYIVLGNRIISGVSPITSSAWILTGATISFAAVGLLLRQISFTFTAPDGWLAIGGMVVLATVIPVFAFLSGLQRVGPARAAILSSLEPVFTVLLAVAVLTERLTPTQILGSGLIIVAVLLLQLRH